MSETARSMANRLQESDEAIDITGRDLNIDSIITESEDDNFISPGMRIMSSKGSEESVTISQSKVKLRHRWIEEKLLNINKVHSLSGGSRHYLPANFSSRAESIAKDTLAQPDSRDEVLLRARKAIEGRRMSREAAKARVRADIDAITGGAENVAGVKELSEKFVQIESLDTRTPEKNSAKAKATAILLASTAKSSNGAKTYGGLEAVSRNKVMSSVDLVTKSIERDQTGEENVESQRRKESTVATVAEEKKKAGVERHEKDRIKDESLLTDRQHKEVAGEELVKGQAKADKLKQHRLALMTAKHAEIEKRVEQERIVRTQKRQMEDEGRRSTFAEAQRLALVEAQRLDEDAAEAELLSGRPAALQYFGIGQIKREADQARKKANDESASIDSSSDRTAAHLVKLFESGDAASCGQVDRILFQGGINGPPPLTDQEHKDYVLEGDFHEDDSMSGKDAEDNSSGSGLSSDIESEPGPIWKMATEEAALSSYELGSDFSPGPMWKKAVEEAALATALAKDLLRKDAPHQDVFITSSSFRQDQVTPITAGSRGEMDALDSNSQYPSEEEAEIDEAEVLNEWKGFKRGRMSFMLAFGVIAGLLPSLYVQMTCHFVTGEVAEEVEVDYYLYYGLHKYTPIDAESVHGYGQCLRYDSQYSYNPPIAPQSAGFVATILGAIPLIIIGVYLFFSVTHKTLWLGSTWMLYLGFLCQLSTLSIFLLDLCQDGIECAMGPGAKATILSSISWFVLSIEMKMNSPLIQPFNWNGVVLLEKESPYTTQIKKFWLRIKGNADAPSLSRTARKRQKERIRKVAAESARYRAPEIV